MPEEPIASAPDAAEPIEATPPTPAAVTAEATPTAPQPKDDPREVRYANQIAEVSRQQGLRAEAERQRDEAIARAAELEAGDGDEDGEAAPTRKQPRTNAEAEQWRERYESSEWTRAQALYGEDVLRAYSAATDLLDRAESPVDYVTAFEAYHQARLGGAAPAAAAEPGLPTLAEATAPRVDPNTSDASPTSPIDPATYAGGANGGVRGWFRAISGATPRS